MKERTQEIIITIIVFIVGAIILVALIPVQRESIEQYEEEHPGEPIILINEIMLQNFRFRENKNIMEVK